MELIKTSSRFFPELKTAFKEKESDNESDEDESAADMEDNDDEMGEIAKEMSDGSADDSDVSSDHDEDEDDENRSIDDFDSENEDENVDIDLSESEEDAAESGIPLQQALRKRIAQDFGDMAVPLEKFSEILEETGQKKTGGSSDIFNRDNASQKQLKWEASKMKKRWRSKPNQISKSKQKWKGNRKS